MGVIQMPGGGSPPVGGKLIGQPEVVEGLITLQVKCSCGTQTLLVGIPGGVRPCTNPECDWAFMIGPQHVMTESGMAWSVAWQRIPKKP